MAKSFLEQFVKSPNGMRRYQQERAISEAVGLICKVMEEKNISRSELATMIGKSRGWVTQLLDGETNKTIRTISDVLAVLGREYHSSQRSIQIGAKSLDSIRHGKVAAESDPDPITLNFYDNVFHLNRPTLHLASSAGPPTRAVK